MKKMEIEDIKASSFEVLCGIRDFCEQHGIQYSLTGGTLIGAVRHKGFIPWDDDIDIMIPRPDYDRFIKLVKSANDLKFYVLSEELCPGEYFYPFAKACHPKTRLVEKGTLQPAMNMGVYVDIFPVDGIADSYTVAKLRTMLFQFLHGLKITSNWTTYRRSKLRKWYYEPFRYVCYVISKVLSQRFIDRTLQRFLRRRSYEKAVYAGRLVGDFGSKEIMKRTLFESTIKLEFEGKLFNAVADYDTFLTRLYGDYMQLPPIEKQVTHHEFEAYWVM